MELIYDKPWKIILNREHPLAERTAVTSEDLKNEIMITMYEGSVSQIADHFRTAFKFRDIIHVNSYNTKLMMVNAISDLDLYRHLCVWCDMRKLR